MKKFVVALIFAALLSCVQVNAAEPIHETFRHKGLEREYFLYLPDGMKEDAPLVIVLHGYGGRAMRGGSALCGVADREKFAVCYPQGRRMIAEILAGMWAIRSRKGSRPMMWISFALLRKGFRSNMA